MAGVQIDDISGKAKEFLSTEQGQKVSDQLKSSSGVDLSSAAKGENSAYEGFGSNDSTSTGGFGRNAAGSAFSRANQMGVAEGSNNDGGDDDEVNTGGNKTGASTPGYRRDGEDGQDVNQTQQFRGQNLSFTAAKKDDDEPEI